MKIHFSTAWRIFFSIVLAFGMAGLQSQGASASEPSTTAIRVFGQIGSMTTNDPNKGGLSAGSLFLPMGLVQDSNGSLYVADVANNRVLYYPAGSTTASRVYGQGGSFTSNTANNGGINANSLYFFDNSNQYSAAGMALDSSGNLYISDIGNNRVLYYPAGSTSATRVYGQSGNFTTNDTHEGVGSLFDMNFCYTDATVGANSLNHPGGLALDSDGNLYVADTGNSRVLYYPAGSTTATRVYGHGGDFTYCLPNWVQGGPNADSLYGPFGLALDSSDNLYVADTLNNRVLRYPAGSTTATRVYGQGGSFTSITANNGGVSANSLNTPSGLALDSDGNLYVADTATNRVLYYLAGSTTASAVYGQGGSFTSNTLDNGGINANSLAYPSGLAVGNSGNLFVADMFNNRVLGYPPPATANPGEPSIMILGNGSPITNGDLTPSLTDGTNFGSAGIPFGTLSQTFTIFNNGTADLNLTDYALVTISGPNAGDFLLTSAPSTPVAYGGGSTAFTVQFSPSAIGTRSATINIGSDDSTKTPFSFAIQGTGVQSDGLTATRSYGQAGSMTTGDPNKGGLGAGSLLYPIGVAVDGSGDLYVADGGNNRVLFYPSGSTTPTRVYGQGGSFTTGDANKGGISASSLYFGIANQSLEGGLAVDKDGNLYVADAINNRVLFYLNGQTTATRVYGQGGSFTTNTSHGGFDPTNPSNPLQCYTDPALSANSLNHPMGVGLDSSGNLYVTDTYNSRVLYYPAGSTTATRVYGQGGSFTSCFPNIIDGNPSANNLAFPTGLALDSSGNLYVADSQNNRVLYFAVGSTTASAVYGQNGSFTTGVANKGGVVSADTLNSPSGLALDGSGNLYVADSLSNRVLSYPSGSTTATKVYGQGGSFTSNTANKGGLSATSLYTPFGLALDGSANLFVADTVNHRVLEIPSSTQPNPGASAMSMTGKSYPISNGSITPSLTNDTDFGIATTPFGVVSHTFAIFNTGTAALHLTGYPRVTISGPNAGDFLVTGAPPSSSVAPGGAWTLFTIQFAPSATGRRSAVISIANDDSANNPFTFAIQGTGSAAPSATTEAATAITFDGATLHGTVNANYANATVTFRYGETASLGSSVTAMESPVTGSVDTPVSATISGLKLATLYHFRVYATNPSGTTRGDDMTFTTGCYSSLTVNSNADDEAGSLRQAIAQACSGATINFNASLSSETILLSSPLNLNKNLTINGSGLSSPVTISGNHAVRVFFIPQGVTATLEGLKIVDGHSNSSGGGIFNMGTLTVTDSTVSGNTCGNSGAGIANGGTLTVTNSSIVGNHSDNNGGGIYSENYPLTVANSTLQGNSAGWYGGGIYLRSGSLTLLNSTLSGNSAVANGGGGLNISGTLNYANTIIAGSPTGGDCASGTIGTNISNLVQDGSCSAALTGDPKLAALANNGGPTQTMALLPGSPAIDAGDSTTCAAAPVNNLDQREATRPQGAHCDIGAYEYIDPTDVSLASFTALVEKKPATRDGISVLLSWETTSEVDNLGFNLYRAILLDGARVKLNAGLIPTLVPPGSPFGAVYRYTDTGLMEGKTYYYWLETVDIHGGKELAGPVLVKLVAGKSK